MRRAVVPENPVLTPRLLRLRRASPLPLPPRTIEWRGFDYGRAALRAGALALGLGPGDTALVPAFVCDVVVRAFRSIGVDVRYYPIGETLAPDYDAAAALVDASTKAFLGVHYFGFPQPVGAMRRFADEHGLAFVEDNAHGLLTEADGAPLGGTGEIGLVSIRKVLPIPTGGALLVNSPAVAARLDAERTSGWRADVAPLARYAARTVARNVELAAGIPFVRGAVGAEGAGPGRPESELVFDELRPWWRVSRRLAAHLDLETIRRRRRERALRWLARLEGDDAAPRPIFAHLDGGTVPLGVPIEVATPGERRWVETLRRSGVEIAPWPDLPADSPEGRWRDAVFTLPVTADQ